MRSDQIYQQVSNKTGIPKIIVEKAYKAYWRFIKDTIEQLPLKDDLNEQQFNALKTNFNVPSLGKLNCTYDRYVGVKKMFKKLMNDESTEVKENKTIVQPIGDNS